MSRVANNELYSVWIILHVREYHNISIIFNILMYTNYIIVVYITIISIYNNYWYICTLSLSLSSNGDVKAWLHQHWFGFKRD